MSNHWIKQRMVKEPSKQYLIDWLNGAGGNSHWIGKVRLTTRPTLSKWIMNDHIAYLATTSLASLSFDKAVPNLSDICVIWSSFPRGIQQNTILYKTNKIHPLDLAGIYTVAKDLLTYDEVNEVFRVFADNHHLKEKTLD